MYDNSLNSLVYNLLETRQKLSNLDNTNRRKQLISEVNYDLYKISSFVPAKKYNYFNKSLPRTEREDFRSYLIEKHIKFIIDFPNTRNNFIQLAYSNATNRSIDYLRHYTRSTLSRTMPESFAFEFVKDGHQPTTTENHEFDYSRYSTNVGIFQTHEDAIVDRLTAQRRLLEASKGISNRNLSMFYRREVLGYSPSELASTYGIAEGTVKQQVHRTRSNLRKNLQLSS